MPAVNIKTEVRTAFQTYLPVIKTVTNAKEDLANKGAANGYASLGADGKIPVGQLPNITINEFLGEAASEAEMLAFVGERGDWCNRTDEGFDYILIADDPSLAGSWRALTTSAAADKVSLTGDETIAGVKTFSSFPITPSSAPTTEYQIANKKYVDDAIVAAGGGASTLDALTDVDVSTVAPTNGQVLTYNDTAGQWEPDDAVSTEAITVQEATDDWNNA